jgi:hypothetical protein
MSSAPKPFLKVGDVWQLLQPPGSSQIEILKTHVVTSGSTDVVPPGFLLPILRNPRPDGDSYQITTFSAHYVGEFASNDSEFSGYVWSGSRPEGKDGVEFRVIVMTAIGGPIKYGYFGVYTGVCVVADLHGSFTGSWCDNENNQGAITIKWDH